MNITFMIGNGFDLNLGLKTGYADFLKWYTKNDCSTSCDKACDDNCEKYLAKRFKDDISRDEQLWSYAEMAFGKYTEKYFKDEVEKFCDCHEEFCINLAEYLKIEQDKLKNEMLSADIKTKVRTSLLNCHENLREVERQEIITSIKNITEHITVNFINFNYTKLLEKVLKTGNVSMGASGLRHGSNGTLGTISHIHGTVEKDMVLGLNDESQVKNMVLFENASPEYLEQIIKIKANQAFAENIDAKVYDLLKSSVFIYIYGMSIGDTDALWWFRICELMSARKNLHIIIHAFDAPDNDLLMRKFNTYKRKLITNFLSYSDLSDDIKEEIRPRIHVDNKNIFKDLSDIAKEDDTKR